MLARWLTPAVDPAARDGLRALLLATAPEGYAGSTEAIAAANLTNATSHLRLPALVLVGDQDEATPQRLPAGPSGGGLHPDRRAHLHQCAAPLPRSC